MASGHRISGRRVRLPTLPWANEFFVPPIIDTHLTNLPPNSKGLLLWIVEGYVLSGTELEYLANLPKFDPRVKVVVEMGGDRVFRWLPLQTELAA